MLADSILTPLLEAVDDETRGQQLERLLVEHATPTIRQVLARFTRAEGWLGRDDLEDVFATVVLRLVRRLQDDTLIANFESYVATLTYNTIHDLMRRRFPERTRLKNRIRYLLTHDRRFALWNAGTEMACGLRAWSGRGELSDAFTIRRAAASAAMLDADRPHDAIAAIFAHTGRPMSLETLVRLLAELWQVTEQRTVAESEATIASLPAHAERYETRQFLETLWREIQALPANQRTALLLNMRDAERVNAVALFLLVGVARFDDIAAAIGVSRDALTSLWDELPLDDATIAARMNLTRQQVINLRSSARQRLARRTRIARGDG